jgi:hypothetical protein
VEPCSADPLGDPNLELTFHPTEAEPRAHYIVKGQCDLPSVEATGRWRERGDAEEMRVARLTASPG